MINRHSFILVSTLVALCAGCLDTTSGTTAADGGGAPVDEGGGAAPDYSALYACSEDAFGDVHALSGPSFDPEAGLLAPLQDSYFVSTTMIYWRAEKTDAFYSMGGRVMAQLESTPGLVAYALGTDETCLVGRAITVWRSEEEMFAFVVSGAHGEAVGQTLELSFTGKGATWSATPDEVLALDWDTARAKLAAVDEHPIYD